MSGSFEAVSLFSGAGGMDVGFESAGIKVVAANELMADAAESYSLNHPNAEMFNADVKEILPNLSAYSGVDFLFGGPPCQGFSVAGKMDPNDARSQLIFTFLDAVKLVQPRVFVMENVKALAKLAKWHDVRKRYYEECSKMGYSVADFVLNATEFNVPQKRERVFFIGVRNDDNLFMSHEIDALLHDKKQQSASVRSVLQPLGPAGTDRNPNTCTAKITFAANPIMRRSPYAGMYFNGQGRPIDVDNYANTLPASMGGNKTPFLDEDYLLGKSKRDWVQDYHEGLVAGSITPEYGLAPANLRRLTTKEAALIQTFPNDYKFIGGNAAIYRQIGNAVPSNLAQAVASAAIDYVQSVS